MIADMLRNIDNEIERAWESYFAILDWLEEDKVPAEDWQEFISYVTETCPAEYGRDGIAYRRCNQFIMRFWTLSGEYLGFTKFEDVNAACDWLYDQELVEV